MPAPAAIGFVNNRFLLLVVVALGLLISTTPENASAYSTYMLLKADDYWNDGAPDFQAEYVDSLTASSAVFYSGRTTQYNQPMSAYASGSFNVSSGVVKFMLQAQGKYSHAGAQIYITEQIFPEWEVAGADEIMNIQLSWSMNGVYTPNGGLLNLGLSSVCGWGVDEPASPGSLDQYNLTDGAEAWIQNVQFNPATDSYLEFGMWINAWIEPFSQIATADFSSTGYMEITMPEGASFTSSSGVFLTGSPVPVPGAVWLLGSGLLGLLGLTRRL